MVLSPALPCSHSRCEDERFKGIPRLVQRSLYEGPARGWYRGVPVGVCRPPSAGRVYCAVASSPGRSAVASQLCQFCVRNYPCYGARPRAQSRGQAPTVASPLTSLPTWCLSPLFNYFLLLAACAVSAGCQVLPAPRLSFSALGYLSFGLECVGFLVAEVSCPVPYVSRGRKCFLM